MTKISNMQHTIFALIISLFLCSCSSQPVVKDLSEKPSPEPGFREPLKVLSQDYAQYRHRLIEDIAYYLSFNIDEDSSDFSGEVKITFKVKNTPQPLTLDFIDGKITELQVNGYLRTPDYNGIFLKIPSQSLQSGLNEIFIKFVHPFSNSSRGLYRFNDPEDKKTYIYSDLEPYEANKIFPCFDQPDLKATYALTVEAPSDWVVITSVRESDVKLTQAKNKKIWYFPKSEKFSTYLFSLHAGPFSSWSSQEGSIPLRLFARKSMARYVSAHEWFKITKEGLRFFNSYFDYSYPFKKYDQVIVPDYGQGAMENVGAVIFSESYIPRGKMTRSERQRRANVILHEMAHMWFGNLVTMRWWNDLWLNESFATYMATLALVEVTEFKEAWRTFFSGVKQWAYWEDQLVTTHPIESSVATTNEAFANFDGITYGKGASVMKQLSFLIGEEKFKRGVQNYFKKHQFSNAELSDFIGSLSEAAQISLDQWTKEWLKTASLNSITPVYECVESKIQNFKIAQTAPDENPFLRKHKTQIALLYKNNLGILDKKEILTVAYQDHLTSVPELDGKSCPDLIHLNFDDHDYVKIKFDQKSLETLKNDISDVKDTFLRQMLWATLWNLVEDAEFPVQFYLSTVFQNLSKEKDDQTILAILKTLHAALAYLPHTKSGKIKESKPSRSHLSLELEKFLLRRFKNSKAYTDVQKYFWDTLTEIGSSPEMITLFSDLLEKAVKYPGIDLDPDRRWKLIKQINTHDPAIGEPLRLKEEKVDSSNSGKLSSIRAEASQPLLEVKENWFTEVTSQNSTLPLSQLSAAMKNFYQLNQESFKNHFSDRFYENLRVLVKVSEQEFLGVYSRYLVPIYCEEESVKKLDLFLTQTTLSLPPIVLKNLKTAKQEDERCIKVRKLAVQTGS